MTSLPFTIEPADLLGGISQEGAAAPLFDATWYSASAASDGIEYHLPPGALARRRLAHRRPAA